MGDSPDPHALTMSPDELRAWMTPYVIAWCKRTGLLRDIAAYWVVEELVEIGPGAKARELAKSLREKGRILNSEEKKSLGVKRRVTLGHMFAGALLSRGIADPSHAALSLASEIATAISREVQRRLIVSYSTPARLMIRGGEKDCAASSAYARRIVPLAQAPIFPLPECDADHCRCSYMRAFDEQASSAPRPMTQVSHLSQPGRTCTVLPTASSRPRPAYSGADYLADVERVSDNERRERVAEMRRLTTMRWSVIVLVVTIVVGGLYLSLTVSP